jgi:uncharacterized protein YkwD
VTDPQAADAAVLRRKKAERRLILIAVILCALGLGYWYFERSVSLSLQQFVSLENSAEHFALNQVKETFSAPPPLRAPAPAPFSPSVQSLGLTRAGIIARTNLERSENGSLPALSESAILDRIATLRTEDMFAKQYFAHVSPDGGSAQSVAKTVGYAELALGENLALGNFAGDKGVVDAWMNSPGHRANILETHYTEIGVAVRRGMFEGETTWIAVQIFGRPASDCVAPDANLKATIDASEQQLSRMAADLQAKKSEIEAMEPKRGPAYNQKVDEYNAEVNQYNQLVMGTKSEVTQYNAEVAAFNQCIRS